MALEQTPANTIIFLTLPDKTETAFSFGEYLAWRASIGAELPERDWLEWVEWLLADDNNLGRVSCWLSIVPFRREKPNNPAVKLFRKHAIEHEISI